MFAYVAACSGTNAIDIEIPRKNIKSLIVHAEVAAPRNKYGAVVAVTSIKPTVTNRRGPTVWYRRPTIWLAKMTPTA